ncbi:MAG: DNA N-6-adenine-methyltransferase [Pseudorhodobacter sp.]|nr:DNA N-6-adenine-methyltransferase [Pseudorhodobacter sp.]
MDEVIEGYSVDAICIRICERWQDSAQAILDAGRMLIGVREQKGYGSWQYMFTENKLPFGPRTARMLMQVARNQILGNRNHGSDLPPSWRTLYELSRVPESDLRQAFDDGRIHPEMARKDVKALIYGHGGEDGLGDEWYTPKWIFDRLGLTFSLDVCGPVDRTHVAVPCERYYTETDDGLSSPWNGTIWCNPPYSNTAPWAARCIQHGDALLLTHIPMNAEWASDVWQACDAMRLFQAIEFVRPDGRLQRPGMWLQLAAFGVSATEALHKLVAPADVAENPRRIPSPIFILGTCGASANWPAGGQAATPIHGQPAGHRGAA